MTGFLKRIALGAVLALGLAGPTAAETVRYATDGYGLGAIVVLAAEKGFFKDQGIEPVVQTYSYGVDTVDAVLAGNADFGIVIDMPLITRLSTGKLVSPAVVGISKPGFHKFFQRASINAPEDLKGKSLGVATGTAQEFVTRSYLEKIGLNPDTDVQLVSFSDLFSIVGALKSGRIDAAWVWSEGTDTMKADANFKFVDDDSVVNTGSGVLLATATTFNKDHQDLVVKTLKALQQAQEYIAANLDDAANTVANKVGADPVKVKAAIEDNRYQLSWGTGPLTNLRNEYDFLVNAGKIQEFDLMGTLDATALAAAVPDAEIDPALKH